MEHWTKMAKSYSAWAFLISCMHKKRRKYTKYTKYIKIKIKLVFVLSCILNPKFII